MEAMPILQGPRCHFAIYEVVHGTGLTEVLVIRQERLPSSNKEGRVVSCLRFSPREYQAICDICLSLNLNRCRPQSLKRLLAQSLADDLPPLAERIALFRRQEIQLLHEHLRGPRRPAEHDLTPEEVEMLAEAGGSLLFTVRFSGLLKHAMVQHFRDNHGELAAKLGRLSHGCFEMLCEQVKLRREKGS